MHWEIGNALSSLLKRRRITLDESLEAIELYLQIPVRFVEVELTESMELAYELGLYAHDAYLLRCAAKYGEVRIKRRDVQVFVVKPQKRKGSPLAVNGFKLKLCRKEILGSIKEGRKSY